MLCRGRDRGVTAADEEIADILRRSDSRDRRRQQADNAARREDAFESTRWAWARCSRSQRCTARARAICSTRWWSAAIQAHRRRRCRSGDETIKWRWWAAQRWQKLAANKLLGQGGPSSARWRAPRATRRYVADLGGHAITLIDTAGIRGGPHPPGFEKYSVLRALKATSGRVVLLIDATEGVTQQDAHIAGMIQQESKSAVVVVNKWDIIEKDSSTMNEFMEKIRHELAFMPYVPVVFISALTGQRVHTVLETAVRVQEERLVRIPTSELNEIVRDAMLRHAPATKQPRPLKIFLAQQVRVDPPTFLFHVNDTRLLHFTYERYLENQIRRRYPFTGTPIRLSFRPRDEDRAGQLRGRKRR